MSRGGTVRDVFARCVARFTTYGVCAGLALTMARGCGDGDAG